MNSASNAPAGSCGLIFHPYLLGERAPLWNSDARGSYFGLSRRHTKSHLARSAIEGTVFNLYSVMLIINKLSGPSKNIKATGGFSKSELWKQCLADIFEKDIYIPENYESSCLGAAILGLYALKFIDDLSSTQDMIGKMDHYLPNKDNFSIYRRTFSTWSHLNEVFAPEYKNIAELQKGTD